MLFCMVKKIEDCIDGKVYGQDAMAGIEKGWVRILDINYAILPENIDSIVKSVSSKIEKNDILIFSGNFTGTDPFDSSNKIDLRTPFFENEKSSSPAFCYVLDDVIKILP